MSGTTYRVTWRKVAFSRLFNPGRQASQSMGDNELVGNDDQSRSADDSDWEMHSLDVELMKRFF